MTAKTAALCHMTGFTFAKTHTCLNGFMYQGEARCYHHCDHELPVIGSESFSCFVHSGSSSWCPRRRSRSGLSPSHGCQAVVARKICPAPGQLSESDSDSSIFCGTRTHVPEAKRVQTAEAVLVDWRLLIFSQCTVLLSSLSCQYIYHKWWWRHF